MAPRPHDDATPDVACFFLPRATTPSPPLQLPSTRSRSGRRPRRLCPRRPRRPSRYRATKLARTPMMRRAASASTPCIGRRGQPHLRTLRCGLHAQLQPVSCPRSPRLPPVPLAGRPLPARQRRPQVKKQQGMQPAAAQLATPLASLTHDQTTHRRAVARRPSCSRQASGLESGRRPRPGEGVSSGQRGGKQRTGGQNVTFFGLFWYTERSR